MNEPEIIIKEREMLRDQLWTSIKSSFSERDWHIFEMRLCQGFTFRKCGEYYNVSKERIRQIYLKVIRRLKHPVRKKWLKQLREIYYEDQEKNQKVPQYH